jgi:uncharacterized MAPEG superfamily protein
MVLIVLLVLALFVIQTLMPNRFREAGPPGESNKLAEALGPRDHPRPYTVMGGRAARALANMQEALPVFLTLALLNLIVGTAAAMAVTGAWVFLIARVIYVPLYLAGIPGLRTLAWAAGWVGLVMMLVPLLDRL